MRTAGFVALWVVLAFFVVRAVVEPFTIDLSDPLTYREDWGGPSLIGVLAVHMVPGLAAAGLIAYTFTVWRRHP